MKVVVALLFLAAQCLARAANAGRDSTPDAPSQQFNNEADSSVLPTREGKEAYTEGEMIPVQLIYGPDHETQATVKEVPVESAMQRQDKGKHGNRVSRSPPETVDSDYADNFGGEHDSKQKNFWSWLSERAGSLGSSAEDVNQALGIEARGPSVGEANLSDLFAKLDLSSPNDKEQGVRRRVQHFQTLLIPIFPGPGVPPVGRPPLELPQNAELFEDPLRYGPPHLQMPPTPYNAMWSAFTNIIEYEDSVKKEGKSRRKRDTDVHSYEDIFVDDFARSGGELGPHITRLKVRRGGVAIAGPGGIATAGSGGTAIVGPGGTAYTTQDGTAVVGPGGRVVEIPPGTSITEIVRSRDNDETSSNLIALPPGARIVATGPVVYYKGLLPYLHAPVPPPIVERLK